jgi:uracil-DNA glycosylase family 4
VPDRHQARDALAELVADALAVLRDHQGRGVLDEAPAPLPAAHPTPIRASTGGEWARAAAIAREAADVAQETGVTGLARIREDLGDCRRCRLCTGRTNLVFGVGDPDADLVVVGEAPGRQEDLKGEPFVGPAGEMLDKMLENVLGLPRSAVYICNVVKCRPPDNRNPLPDEVAACAPYLERQIRSARPKLLLVLGGVAFKSLFHTEAGITRARGAWRDWHGIPAMPTFHPAYLLRNPADKRLVFEDLKQVRARFDQIGGRRP